MLTNANKGTYLVKKWQKHANVIYERPLDADGHMTNCTKNNLQKES